MRASDLLGRAVLDSRGRRCGVVMGIRCTLDGPQLGALHALRVGELIVSRRRRGRYLGYQQEDQRGPWLVAALVRRLHRNDMCVPWSDVTEIDEAGIRTRRPFPGQT